MRNAQVGSAQNEFIPWCSNIVALLRALSHKNSPSSTDAQSMFKRSVAPPFNPDCNIRVEYGSVLYAVLVSFRVRPSAAAPRSPFPTVPEGSGCGVHLCPTGALTCVYTSDLAGLYFEPGPDHNWWSASPKPADV
jgi:hypothetical protein